jgi:hypothetical protein
MPQPGHRGCSKGAPSQQPTGHKLERALAESLNSEFTPLNHLKSTSDLAHCFASVRAALVDGGQFLFDLLEPSHFRGWNYISVLEEPDAIVIRRGFWDDNAGQGTLRITGALEEGKAWFPAGPDAVC